jgi:lysophospholipase L1-like esterase
MVLLLALGACDQYAAAADPSTSAAPTPELTPAPAAPVADPCAVGDVAAGGSAEVLRDATGACIPAETSLSVRCDPSAPPAILLDQGASTFLGGRYATLAGPPDDIEVVGSTTMGRFWRSTIDPRRLFLESSGAWERWYLLPDAEALASPPEVLLIGDSILDGAAEATADLLPEWTVTVDAEVGRGAASAVTAAEAALVDAAPDAVVIQIGTNDHDPVGFGENAKRILAAARGADVVVWVTAHTPDTDADHINAEIRRAVARVPQAIVADWDTFVDDEQLSSDGVHPAPGNERLLADLLVPLLDGWRAQVEGASTVCTLG